jgi:hypoxanthine-DNA glycosylase
LFWDIIYRICYLEWPCEKVVSEPYSNKIETLINNKIALWDVLKYCDRKGSSLDIHIENEKENDLKTFFKDYTSIKYVFFNGHESRTYFFRSNPQMNNNNQLKFFTLYSTSPTNRTNSFKILNQWLQIRNYF